MIHPVGRLPSQVYWRRRLFLAGIVLALAVSLGWFFTGGASGDAGASADRSAAAATTAAEELADDQALTGLELVVPSLVPIDPAQAGDPGAAGVPTEGTAPANPVPPEPGPCPDEAIGLSVGSEFVQYAAGSKPRLGLNVTNISAIACIRDLDVALQTWGLFTADGTRLWGSNDCYPNLSAPRPQLLQPGQVFSFTITWSGKTSEPMCSAPRQILGPGTYILRGYLANLVSPDTGFVLI